MLFCGFMAYKQRWSGPEKMTTNKIKIKRQVKKEQIFRTALEVFGKYGYKKATLEDIAKKLGMTKSGLYRYIKDKIDLYEKAVSFGLIKWRQTSIDAIEGETDPVLQLKNYAMTGLTYLNKDKDLHNVLLKDPTIFPLNTKEDRFSEINREAINLLKGILRQGVEKKIFRSMDIDHTASFLYSVYVMFIIKSYVKSDIDSIDEMLNAGLDTLLYGVVKK
ncbi:MAG: TetR/AcrR family transcriptional regulator [Deltaproteobacteria bacterium]|nr:MAG: TetR/AcrR family transcriptional regulator [Deltaproteobacteria bacterium]